MFPEAPGEVPLLDILTADFRYGIRCLQQAGPFNLDEKLVFSCALRAFADFISEVPGLKPLLIQTGRGYLLKQFESGKVTDPAKSYRLLVAQRDKLRRQRNLLRELPGGQQQGLETVQRHLYLVCAVESLVYQASWQSSDEPGDYSNIHDLEKLAPRMAAAAVAPFYYHAVEDTNFPLFDAAKPYRRRLGELFLTHYQRGPSNPAPYWH
jgi:hypothetical protein